MKMLKFVAEQICNSCGKEFVITYHDRNGGYLFGKDSCECEDSFSPCEGVPSISQWLEANKSIILLPDKIAEFVLNKENISLVPGMVYVEYKDESSNMYKAISKLDELSDEEPEFISIEFESPGCGDTVEAVSTIEEALVELEGYCLTHYTE